MQLHFDLVPGVGAPRATLVLLHGILGQGSNLRSLARRFVDAAPGWSAALMDLRAHGQSLGVGGPDTLESAADDVRQTLARLSVPATAVLGHSFGGKVALRLLHEPGLQHLVTVDSGPGPRVTRRGSETTVEVLSLLRALPGPWATREAFVRDVEAGGQSRALAQWLAMNLRREPHGFVFGLELPRIEALLQSYFEVDLWPEVEAQALARTGAQLHLVIGERSQVYDAAERARVEQLARASDGHLTVDTLPAAHWVHVDDPAGLLRVLLARLT
jgi:pimeloyl-ACP methyl ester carboxylesterase